MNKTMSIVLYKEAGKAARRASYEDAFEDYAEAFLSRLDLREITLEFVSFYRYQLAVYLRSKPVFTLSLPEGDMISDLIKDAYDSFVKALNDSPFNVTGEGRRNLPHMASLLLSWGAWPKRLLGAAGEIQKPTPVLAKQVHHPVAHPAGVAHAAAPRLEAGGLAHIVHPVDGKTAPVLPVDDRGAKPALQVHKHIHGYILFTGHDVSPPLTWGNSRRDRPRGRPWG